MLENSLPTFALDAPTLQNPDVSLRREWLVTNGLGGYASSSVAGANTRRYHGLLVAALAPPLGRAVLLSKLEETLQITPPGGGPAQSFALSANLYPGVTYPTGYETLELWTNAPMPTWVWSPIPGLRFEKQVWMARERNVTYIAYTLRALPTGSAALLNLVPLLAWKDYHSEMRAYPGDLHATWSAPSEPGRLSVTLPGVMNVTPRPLSLQLFVLEEDGAPFPNAWFTAQPDWYRRFQHPRERERGLDYEEDLYTPGAFSALLQVGQTLVVAATVVGADAEEESISEIEPPRTSRAGRIARQAELIENAGADDAFAQALALAADAFVVPIAGGRVTIIAGYPWFADWGRDTMIALPGLCLATGRAKIARAILASFAAFVSEGMLPNRFPDQGETPEYNTADATLWYFVAIYRYIEATGDLAFLRETLWDTLEDIVRWHQTGTRYNIRVDSADNLLYAGQEGVQLTWMDAKVGDWVVTPRIGKPVEINALWHNALRTMADFARRLGDDKTAKRYAQVALATARSFAARFARPDGYGLYDTLDTPPAREPDMSVRPNQIFALSLPFAPLEPKTPLAASIVRAVQDELYTEAGIRTLSPHDTQYYHGRYEGDPRQRDAAYHQGTAWPWLMGPFAEAHYKAHGDKEAARDLLRPLEAQLTACGIGSLSEVYDGDPPQRPNGCIAQAWSVSETLRVWRDLAE